MSLVTGENVTLEVLCHHFFDRVSFRSTLILVGFLSSFEKEPPLFLMVVDFQRLPPPGDMSIDPEIHVGSPSQVETATWTEAACGTALLAMRGG